MGQCGRAIIKRVWGPAHEIFRPLKNDSLSRTTGAAVVNVTVTDTVSPLASSADSVPSENRRRLLALLLFISSNKLITESVPAVLAVIVNDTDRAFDAGSTLSVDDRAYVPASGAVKTPVPVA